MYTTITIIVVDGCEWCPSTLVVSNPSGLEEIQNGMKMAKADLPEDIVEIVPFAEQCRSCCWRLFPPKMPLSDGFTCEFTTSTVRH